MSFPASYDTATKITTAVVLAILVAAAILIQSPILAGLGLLSMALGYAYSPRSYSIAARFIIVNRLMGNIRIPLDDAREVRVIGADEFCGCLRLWGSGGFFGYYGIFQMPRLGKATWYLTNRRRAVAVVTARKTALFSPDDVDGFIATIQSAVPVAQVASPAPAIRSSGTAMLIGKLLGALMAVGVIAFVTFAVLYSPGPPACTLAQDALTIRDRFYPVIVSAVSVDVDHIRVVDIATDPDWRPTARTNGFANAHYHSGWFRVANGQKVRLYRTDGTRLVLLPPQGDGVPVLLEARDPEEFARKVRQEWSPHS